MKFCWAAVADNKPDSADRTAENTDSAVADCRQSAVRYQPQAVQSAHSRKGSVQHLRLKHFQQAVFQAPESAQQVFRSKYRTLLRCQFRDCNFYIPYIIAPYIIFYK